jgi:ATP-dependent DNA helicase RecQ
LAQPIHRAIAALRTGDVVQVKGRFVHSISGQIVGRLAASAETTTLQRGVASVVTVMVRTRSQTPEEYWSSLKADHWETPLLEVQIDG